MLEKTYTTFYASNVLLQQQYREHNFTRYFELISFLLVAEQNNELLMKNHHAHPTGSTPFPEANRTLFHGNKGNRGRGRGTLFVDVHIFMIFWHSKRWLIAAWGSRITSFSLMWRIFFRAGRA
jgi:hypothetical protein